MTNDRASIMERLVLVEENIAVGERSIFRQRKLVTEFEETGGDPADGRRILQELEVIQAGYAAERDRLRNELAKYLVVDARKRAD
jgi:hypothetical protein